MGSSQDSVPDRQPLESWNEAEADATPLLRRAIELIRTDFAETTWLCFRRTVLEDAKAVEVAEELGMTAQAVRQAKYRVLMRLREEFGGLIDLTSIDNE